MDCPIEHVFFASLDLYGRGTFAIIPIVNLKTKDIEEGFSMRKSFAVVFGAACLVSAAHADTVLWYRFDGDGATIENKANPGTMDGTLKSITWVTSGSAISGLGDDSSKFPTCGYAFPDGTRLIDPVADVIQSDTVKSLSFSGDPDNSGTVFLDKRNNSDFATLEGLSSFTCEVMFKLPENSETLSSRISKEILFPLVGIGSAITTGQGWSICLRNDNDGNGFYPFVRCQYKNGANATGGTLYDYQITSSPVTQGVWHHLALSVSVVGTTVAVALSEFTCTLAKCTSHVCFDTVAFPVILSCVLINAYPIDTTNNKISNNTYLFFFFPFFIQASYHTILL